MQAVFHRIPIDNCWYSGVGLHVHHVVRGKDLPQSPSSLRYTRSVMRGTATRSWSRVYQTIL